MQCPACGATNPETAAWCGQCYTRFDAPPAPPSTNGSSAPDEVMPEPAAPPFEPPAEAPVVPAAAPGDLTTEGFRRQGDELEWECPECGQFNAIELTSCAICGTSFLERFRTETPEPPRNWPAALLLSVFAPGAGHVSVGRYGTGWARLVLFVAWVLGAVVLATSAGSGALIVATPLLLGALVLWALTLVDLYRLQQGESEILSGRAFLWLVVAVLLLMAVALFGSMGTAAQPAS